MHDVSAVLAVLGIVLRVPSIARGTLCYENRDNAGASILFPDGELYSGPAPDWTITQAVPVIELQLNNPVNSRLIWVHENQDKLYVDSGYMQTMLGRLRKHWAVSAAEADGLAVI